jgi:hypothetical protein
MGYKDIKKITDQIGAMEDSRPTPLVPIVLRHREYSNWPGYFLTGLFGLRVRKGQGMGGMVVYHAEVDPTSPAMFFNDKNNVQYSVIPDCEHNRQVLTDPLNVRQLLMPTKEDPVPVLTIVEAPQDLKDLIEAEKKKPAPKQKKAEPNPMAGKDPFVSVPLNEKLTIDGEADHHD